MISPTSSSETKTTTDSESIAKVDRGMLGLGVTIGIAVAIVLLIVIGAVITTIATLMVIRRRRASQHLTSDGKKSSSGTQVAVGNGVGEF